MHRRAARTLPPSNQAGQDANDEPKKAEQPSSARDA